MEVNDLKLNTVEKKLFAHAESNSIPINGSMELLPLCNMNCDMCYVKMTGEEVKKCGTIRSAEEWLSIGKEMLSAGVVFLLLTGGEPLLHPEFKEIYLGLKRMGFVLTINTNGTILDEEWADFFMKNKPRRINITLYGSSPETYENLCHYRDGFSRTIDAIRLLKSRDVDVKISATIARKNQEDVKEIIDIAKELDIPINVDTYLQTAHRERELPFDLQSRMSPEEAAAAYLLSEKHLLSEQAYKTFIEMKLQQVDTFPKKEAVPSHMACLAGKCSFSINWQGNLRPCVIMGTPSISVFEYGFLDAWKNLHEEISRIYLNGKCTACRLQPLCRICAAASLYETGDFQGIPAYLCRYAEKLYQLLLQSYHSLL